MQTLTTEERWQRLVCKYQVVSADRRACLCKRICRFAASGTFVIIFSLSFSFLSSFGFLLFFPLRFCYLSVCPCVFLALASLDGWWRGKPLLVSSSPVEGTWRGGRAFTKSSTCRGTKGSSRVLSVSGLYLFIYFNGQGCYSCLFFIQQ